MDYSESNTVMKKIDLLITEINYAICLVYMLYFLIFPEREYSVSIFDYLILAYLYLSTTILILRKWKKRLW
jgi:hypothetical protein